MKIRRTNKLNIALRARLTRQTILSKRQTLSSVGLSDIVDIWWFLYFNYRYLQRQRHTLWSYEITFSEI